MEQKVIIHFVVQKSKIEIGDLIRIDDFSKYYQCLSFWNILADKSDKNSQNTVIFHVHEMSDCFDSWPLPLKAFVVVLCVCVYVFGFFVWFVFFFKSVI